MDLKRKRQLSDCCLDEDEDGAPAKKSPTSPPGSPIVEEPSPVLEELPKEAVVILDAGAQYGKVIDRKIREAFVESLFLPLSTSASIIKAQQFKAVIISGGPGSVNDDNALDFDRGIFHLGIPVLGLCYGMQLINKCHGGRVSKKSIREDGQCSIDVINTNPLFHGLAEQEPVLLTHGDSVQQDELAEDFDVIANSGQLVAGICHKEKPIYGLQFHPEVELTVNGSTIFKNFLYNISSCTPAFTIPSRELSCINMIREAVGEEAKVLSLVSGGVDSAVCTVLLHKAIGTDRVIAVHINNGFMRKGESQQVEQMLREQGINVIVLDKTHMFLTATTSTTDSNQDSLEIKSPEATRLAAVILPEAKRNIIGDSFMQVFREIILKLDLELDGVYLAQGTLRPDLIESASLMTSSNATVIKTHHNDTQMVRELREQGRVIEPLKDFHKDEVRQLARELGLPNEIIERHPFPGPGLAIRVLCTKEPFIDDTFAPTNTLLMSLATFHISSLIPSPITQLIIETTSQQEQNFLMDVTKEHQLSITLLPIKTVGVQGDARTYSYVAAMSCDTLPSWGSLYSLAKLIPRICHNINRVVWVFGNSVQGPIEDITPTTLTQTVLSTTRQADYVASQILAKHDLQKCISQMPVVLVPVHFDRPSESKFHPSCQRSVVIRTFITSDFMTGVPAIPDKDIPADVLLEMVTAIMNIPGISRVMYDLTPKPPGTTEWE